MFKLFVFVCAAILAVATAGYVAPAAVSAYSAGYVSPYAYSAGYAGPHAYSAGYAHPYGYSAYNGYYGNNFGYKYATPYAHYY